MFTEQELDSLLGRPVVFNGFYGILIKNKSTGKYAVYDSAGIFPLQPYSGYGLKINDINQAKPKCQTQCETTALENLQHPQSRDHLQIINEWYFEPMIGSLKAIEYKITYDGFGSENISSAKKSLGPDMEFFFGKDPNINPDGTLKIKGPREFL